MEPQDPQNQPKKREYVGESAFLSQQLSNQSTEPEEVMPVKPKRKRRWFLRLMVLSLLGTAIGGGVLTSLDRGLRKTRSFVRGFLPDSFFEDPPIPTGPSFGVQKGKLKNEDKYREFIDSLELKYISADELIQPHRNIRNGIKNELPPKRYWKRIEETLLVADAIREELGVPLQAINSAYRSPDYNQQCKGVSNSYHTKNVALDLVYGCSPKQAALAAKKLRAKGVFKGGIGVYSSFIHIDTRGRNANWGLSTA